MSDDIYFSAEGLADFITDAKIYNGMSVIGPEGGTIYGIGPYFSCYVLFETEEHAPAIIRNFLYLFRRFNEIKNEPWTWFSNLTYEEMDLAENYDLDNLEKNCLERFEKIGFLNFKATTSIDTEYSSAVWGGGNLILVFSHI